MKHKARKWRTQGSGLPLLTTLYMPEILLEGQGQTGLRPQKGSRTVSNISTVLNVYGPEQGQPGLKS